MTRSKILKTINKIRGLDSTNRDYSYEVSDLLTKLEKQLAKLPEYIEKETPRKDSGYDGYEQYNMMGSSEMGPG